MRRRGATAIMWAALLCTLASASDEVARSLTHQGTAGNRPAARRSRTCYEDPLPRILEEGAAPHLVEVLTNGASLQAKVAPPAL